MRVERRARISESRWSMGKRGKKELPLPSSLPSNLLSPTQSMSLYQRHRCGARAGCRASCEDHERPGPRTRRRSACFSLTASLSWTESSTSCMPVFISNKSAPYLVLNCSSFNSPCSLIGNAYRTEYRMRYGPRVFDQNTLIGSSIRCEQGVQAVSGLAP